MRKIFVLDTNILIHDPNSIYNFRGNDVFLPIEVIEEIDKLKENLIQVFTPEWLQELLRR